MHKSVAPIKKRIRASKFDAAELMALLRFLMALLQTASGSKHLTKAQRRSLAITENQLGIHRKSKRSKHSSKKGRGHKPKSGKKWSPPRGSAQAMRLAHSQHISLKEAWRRVKAKR